LLRGLLLRHEPAVLWPSSSQWPRCGAAQHAAEQSWDHGHWEQLGSLPLPALLLLLLLLLLLVVLLVVLALSQGGPVVAPQLEQQQQRHLPPHCPPLPPLLLVLCLSLP
jgi:hypothetical protein